MPTRFTPGCYLAPPNHMSGPGGPFGFHMAQGREAGSLPQPWWFALQDDGTIQMIGFGDLSRDDVARIAQSLTSGEAWFTAESLGRRLPAPGHLMTLTRGEVLESIDMAIFPDEILLIRGKPATGNYTYSGARHATAEELAARL